jgi:prepilin-type processing-associated H-X9-DG protein
MDLFFDSISLLEPRPLSTITSLHDKVYLERCIEFKYPGHGGGGPDLISFPFRIPVMVLFVDGHVAGLFFWDDDFELILNHLTLTPIKK